MSRGSAREYGEPIRGRYRRSSRTEKGKILDEFTQAADHHRKAAVRVLRREHGPPVLRRGSPREYGAGLMKVGKVVWEVTDHLCGKRLKPFLRELVAVLVRQRELELAPKTAEQLGRISAASIDRLLKPYRRRGIRRPFSTTKPGSLLKGAIPIRTFTDWDEGEAGFVEVDLVAHCGESTEGLCLTSLCAVDVATGWAECQGGMGQRPGKGRRCNARDLNASSLFLLGLDSDNGSEFINQHLYRYCRREAITFTRSRPYRKNDSCHVEQKNWSVVRRLVGYHRYSSRAAMNKLNQLYRLLRLYVNFFQPSMKLKQKSKDRARAHKVSHSARTPYHRLLESNALSSQQMETVDTLYCSLNPVELRARINQTLDRLWNPAKHHDRKEVSVTPFMRQALPVR